jgi:Rrf2 family protein
MVLKNQVEWALHCCLFLADLPEGKYLAAKDLAEFHGVPKEYLGKALQRLSAAGLVEATLGPAGGYRLAKPVAAITFLDIVEAVEGRRATFACTEIRMNNPCRSNTRGTGKPCSIAQAMYDADEAWRAHLRSLTLESMSAGLGVKLPKEQLEATRRWVEQRIN